MINFFKKFKIISYKLKNYKLNRGMTYVELIVVLSIFAIMSSIVLFNYGKFQAKVDINNLANDVALKIVQAQKDAMSGKLPSPEQQMSITPTWKPSYGVYFNLSTFPKSFVYFTDLNNSTLINPGFGFTDPICSSECIDKIDITKGNYISELKVYYNDNTTQVLTNNLTLTFTRPNSGVIMESGVSLLENVSYVQITVASPQSVSARIKLYSSGRVEILPGITQSSQNESVPVDNTQVS